MTKTCTKCLKTQPLSNFSKRSGGKTKQLYKSHCKSCYYKQHKEWTQKNPETVRNYRAKDKWTLQKRCNRHNISVEEFWAIYENQDGSCPICDKAIQPEDSAIDHNHKTGEVRGLLHKSCNRALGMLGDNPENLIRAASYLKKKGYYG